MAIDLSLPSNCVTHLPSCDTDQVHNPEEAEDLPEFCFKPLSTDLPDKAWQLWNNQPQPNLETPVEESLQNVSDLHNKIDEGDDLLSVREYMLLEIGLLNQLLQIVSQVTPEAQSPSMKRFCHTMHTHLQLKIDRLIEACITLNGQITGCRHQIIDAAEAGICDPEEVVDSIERLNAAPSDRRSWCLCLSRLEPQFRPEMSNRQILPTDQRTYEQIAQQLKPCKDMILMFSILQAEFDVVQRLTWDKEHLLDQYITTDQGKQHLLSHRVTICHDTIEPLITSFCDRLVDLVLIENQFTQIGRE